MQFKLTNSFADNLALLQTEVEKIDPERAKILFDNIAPLCIEGDATRDRAALAEFHKAVLKSLDGLPTQSAGGKK